MRDNSGAAIRAVTGPVAAIDDIVDVRFIAFDHASHVMAPAAAPAATLRTMSITNWFGSMLNAFVTTKPIAAIRSIRPFGRTNLGSRKFVIAKLPTWATAMALAVPSETPYRSEIGVSRNGVAVKRNVTAAVAAIRATGAPELPP